MRRLKTISSANHLGRIELWPVTPDVGWLVGGLVGWSFGLSDGWSVGWSSEGPHSKDLVHSLKNFFSVGQKKSTNVAWQIGRFIVRQAERCFATDNVS